MLKEVSYPKEQVGNDGVQENIQDHVTEEPKVRRSERKNKWIGSKTKFVGLVASLLLPTHIMAEPIQKHLPTTALKELNMLIPEITPIEKSDQLELCNKHFNL